MPHSDPTRTARGIVLGVAMGLMMWAAAGAIFISGYLNWTTDDNRVIGENVVPRASPITLN